MNNFVFKIFGAPHTFDLYKGNGKEIDYFQTFDNGSKENVKLVVHRMASGNVSYSYLRYNFISGGGRENSWLGMSVLFDGEYCRDIEGIYELFDTVYNKIILKNGKLIVELNNNSKAQAKYLVRKFTEADAEVSNIENNIINNLKNNFAKDILPLDSSFINESSGLIKLNYEKGNAHFVAALKQYSWLSISPEYDYKEKEEVSLSPDDIKKIDEIITGELARIHEISVKMLKGVPVQIDIEKSYRQIQSTITAIKPHLEKQIELQDRMKKLYECQERLDEYAEISSGNNKYSPHTENSYLQQEQNWQQRQQQQNWRQEREQNWRQHQHQHQEWEQDLYQRHKNKDPDFGWRRSHFSYIRYLAITVLGLIAIAGILYVVFFYPSPNKKDAETPPSPSEAYTHVSPEDETEKLIKEGHALLEDGKFDEAIEKYGQAGDNGLVEKAKEKAWSSMLAEATQLEKKGKHKEAVDLLKQMEKYGDRPDTYIADIQAKIKPPKPTKVPGYVNIKKNDKDVQGSVYTLGEKLEITAMLNQAPLSGGIWRFNSDNIEMTDPNSNPTTIQMRKKGTCSLYYRINDEEQASITITIQPKQTR